MKKKGYTLLEMICVLAIMIVIFSLGLGGFRYYQGLKTDINVETALYELEDIMTFGKSYCLKEKSKGKIVIKKDDGVLKASFLCNNGFERSRILGDYFNIYKEGYQNIEHNSKELSVSKEGHLSAGTIYIKDVRGNKYKITVRVGVDLIIVKQE